MDMSPAITPKSDQLNNDDLLTGPITIRITDVAIKPGEQPVAISYEGDNGKPYKPCKSMCRVMVSAWGADASKYKGRSMTLYSEPTVKWGGMEVGGIRISHLSDIDSKITMALTATKGSKKPFSVQPLVVAPRITADEVAALEKRCQENDITVAALLKKAGVSNLSAITADDLPRAHSWLDAKIAAKKPPTDTDVI